MTHDAIAVCSRGSVRVP